MSDKKNPSLGDKLTAAYDLMLERLHAGIDKTDPAVHKALDSAMEKTSELGELGREEAERVAGYLRRDLESAATFLDREGGELRDWLRFDLHVVEQKLADTFTETVDHTRETIARFELEATASGEWHTGEVTGIGTLQCKGCGEELHFHHTSHIPPCPKCRGSRFRRLSTSDE